MLSFGQKKHKRPLQMHSQIHLSMFRLKAILWDVFFLACSQGVRKSQMRNKNEIFHNFTLNLRHFSVKASLPCLNKSFCSGLFLQGCIYIPVWIISSLIVGSRRLGLRVVCVCFVSGESDFREEKQNALNSSVTESAKDYVPNLIPILLTKYYFLCKDANCTIYNVEKTTPGNRNIFF